MPSKINERGICCTAFVLLSLLSGCSKDKGEKEPVAGGNPEGPTGYASGQTNAGSEAENLQQPAGTLSAGSHPSQRARSSRRRSDTGPESIPNRTEASGRFDGHRQATGAQIRRWT